MFVAQHKTGRDRVTSIAARWDHREDELRELARTGQLICPECAQELWFRVGDCRRRHFAHRQRTDCPVGKESPEVLEAKAQLYRWLESKYPGCVELDVKIDRSQPDLKADLVVQLSAGLRFVYWVFDRQQRERWKFLGYRKASGIHLHFIHTGTTHKPHSDTLIDLTQSQRDFIYRSDYDSPPEKWGAPGHLHFIDTETGRLIIYRGLKRIHDPNLFGWTFLREGPLDTALIVPRSGEIVFAADEAQRQEWQRTPHEPEVRRPGPYWKPPTPHKEPPATAPKAGATTAINGPFRCEDCGIETTDWVSAEPSKGTCVCRLCTQKRHKSGGANEA